MNKKKSIRESLQLALTTLNPFMDSIDKGDFSYSDAIISLNVVMSLLITKQVSADPLLSDLEARLQMAERVSRNLTAMIKSHSENEQQESQNG